MRNMHSTFIGLLALFVTAAFASSSETKGAFHPKDYPKSVATCKAVKRQKNGINIDVNIDIHYVDINPTAEHTIVLVHGWPGLWSTWSKQIEEFENDYHLLVPDLRGFGSSTHPGDVELSSTSGDIVGDLVCMLEHAGITSAICMGHDWGSQMCYQAARMRPDIFYATVNLVVPYISSARPMTPLKQLVTALPTLSYQIFFSSDPKLAAQELDKDVRRTLRGTLRTVDSPPPAGFLKDTDSFMNAWQDTAKIPRIPFFSVEEENYMVEQYKIQGFSNTLYFYTNGNRKLTHAFDNKQGNFTIHVPCLAIYPLNDPVANWNFAAKILYSLDYLPNLITKTMPGAHWMHIENPKEFNAIVRPWLQQTIVKHNEGRLRDEL